MKITTIQSITVQDWDDEVNSVYGRPYSYQQQDGCKFKGTETFSVPIEHPFDFEETEIPEEVNGDEMGVSFAAWLARDPAQPLQDSADGYPRSGSSLDLFWRRNFYPSFDMIAQDLHVRGLLPAGEYQLVIDW